jgi:hypothetical protein
MLLPLNVLVAGCIIDMDVMRGAGCFPRAMGSIAPEKESRKPRLRAAPDRLGGALWRPAPAIAARFNRARSSCVGVHDDRAGVCRSNDDSRRPGNEDSRRRGNIDRACPT